MLVTPKGVKSGSVGETCPFPSIKDEDSWVLRCSSNIWWVSTKPTACVRPTEQYWVLWGEQKSSHLAYIFQHTEELRHKTGYHELLRSITRWNHTTSTDEPTARSGHWKIISSVLSVWDSGLTFVWFPTITNNQASQHRVIMASCIEVIGSDKKKNVCTL